MTAIAAEIASTSIAMVRTASAGAETGAKILEVRVASSPATAVLAAASKRTNDTMRSRAAEEFE